MFLIFAPLGATVGTMSAFNLAAAFLFDDVDGSQGSVDLFLSEVLPVQSAVYALLNHLSELFAQCVPRAITEHLDASSC